MSHTPHLGVTSWSERLIVLSIWCGGGAELLQASLGCVAHCNGLWPLEEFDAEAFGRPDAQAALWQTRLLALPSLHFTVLDGLAADCQLEVVRLSEGEESIDCFVLRQDVLVDTVLGFVPEDDCRLGIQRDGFPRLDFPVQEVSLRGALLSVARDAAEHGPEGVLHRLALLVDKLELLELRLGVDVDVL